MPRSSGVYLQEPCNCLTGMLRNDVMNAYSEPIDRELDGLLQKIAGGDRLACARMYDMTSARLFAVVRCVVRKPELAEEALQEAFVRVWQKASLYDPGKARPMAWLAAIARNQAIDLKRRFAEKLSEKSDPEDAAAGVVMPAGELALELRKLRECLARLPEDRQDMVLLAYYQGWSRDELAVQFKRPATTVKTLLRRSLMTLKECLDGRT